MEEQEHGLEEERDEEVGLHLEVEDFERAVRSEDSGQRAAAPLKGRLVEKLQHAEEEPAWTSRALEGARVEKELGLEMMEQQE
jgi:hypothetical protein